MRPSPDPNKINNTNARKNTALQEIYNESDILSKRHRPEKKCSMKSFLDKRKEILMLNMSINTQQEEIDKLEQDLKDREAKVKEKEASLNESMKRFDCFLLELDQKVSIKVYEYCVNMEPSA